MTNENDLRSAVMGAITDVWDRSKQIDDAADEVLDLIEADRKRRGEPVATIRHFQYEGIARNGPSQEAVMIDGAPMLPDGTQLYAASQPADPALLASANRMLSDRLERVAHVLRGSGLEALKDITTNDDLQQATAALAGAYQMMRFEKEDQWNEIGERPKPLSTAEAAAVFNIKPRSLLRALYAQGHYLGLMPFKQPNGRLLWDSVEVNATVRRGPRGGRLNDIAHALRESGLEQLKDITANDDLAAVVKELAEDCRRNEGLWRNNYDNKIVEERFFEKLMVHVSRLNKIEPLKQYLPELNRLCERRRSQMEAKSRK